MQLKLNTTIITHPLPEWIDATGKVWSNPTLDFLKKKGWAEYVAPVVPLTAEQIAAQIATNVEMLWYAATEYEKRYIYGAALSMLTIGVMQNKPKALAISAWIGRIWNEHYYPQKALMTATTPPYDFSIVGPMPHSVPELRAEVFGV